MRYNCGGGPNSTSFFKVVHCIGQVERQRKDRRQLRKRLRGRNCERSPGQLTKPSWRQIAEMPPSAASAGWNLVEPAGFDDAWNERIGCAARGVCKLNPIPVSWSCLRAIYEWDERVNGDTRVLWWLSGRHIAPGPFDKMSVGLAKDVLEVRTARMLRWLRETYV